MVASPVMRAPRVVASVLLLLPSAFLVVCAGSAPLRGQTAQPLSPTDLLESPAPEQPEGEAENGSESGSLQDGGQEDSQEGLGQEPAGGGESGRPIPGELDDPETYRRLWEDVSTTLLLFIPDLLAALLILAALFVVSRVFHGVLRQVFDRSNADPAMASILLKLTRYTLLALAVLMAASQLGIQVGSLLAGIGILGLAIGLAAQESLANLIAGLTLLWDRPFRIGDRVTIADMYGTVEEIGLRSTRMMTLEHLDVILPNREIINRKIINHTRSPRMRLPIAVSIAYAEDTRVAREVLLRKIRGHELIETEPEPEVVVKELAASGVDLEIRVWLKNPHQERRATFELTELAKIALDEAGIEIPFPQTTLHYGTGEFPVRLVGRPESDPVDSES